MQGRFQRVSTDAKTSHVRVSLAIPPTPSPSFHLREHGHLPRGTQAPHLLVLKGTHVPQPEHPSAWLERGGFPGDRQSSRHDRWDRPAGRSVHLHPEFSGSYGRERAHWPERGQERRKEETRENTDGRKESSTSLGRSLSLKEHERLWRGVLAEASSEDGGWLLLPQVWLGDGQGPGDRSRRQAIPRPVSLCCGAVGPCTLPLYESRFRLCQVQRAPLEPHLAQTSLPGTHLGHQDPEAERGNQATCLCGNVQAPHGALKRLRLIGSQKNVPE